MEKKLLIALNLFSALHGMEILYESPKPEIRSEIPFDLWDFFSERNSLDKLGAPIPLQSKQSLKNDLSNYLSIDAVANLHILRNSKLQTKNRIIFDAGCDKGHISAFLAQDAHSVYAYDADRSNIASANTKYNLENLLFSNDLWDVSRPNSYDLAVSCVPSTDMETFQKLSTLLKPQGEIFCLFTTRSNPEPIEATVLREIFPKIRKCISPFDQHALHNFAEEHKKKYPLDESLKMMIATFGFEIITFEQKNFNIEIQDIHRFKSFHASLIMNLEIMNFINPKKREKIADCFMCRMIAKLKKTKPGHFIYPCSKTIVHIRKKDV